MSERKRVWGLYNYNSKVWLKDNNNPPKRLRYVDGLESYKAAENHEDSVQPRPFFVRSRPLPADVQELIAAVRDVMKESIPGWFTTPENQRVCRAVRALDGKY